MNLNEEISELSKEQFRFFYLTLLGKLKVSKHSWCDIQVWAVLTAHPSTIQEALNETIERFRDE